MDNQQSQPVVQQHNGNMVVAEPAPENDVFRQMEARGQKQPVKRPKMTDKWRNKFDNMPPKKQKIVMVGTVVGFLVVIVLITVVSILAISKVNYQESYLVAKELRTEIQDIKNDFACNKVVDYVGLSSTTMQVYNDYVEQCRKTGERATDLVKDLGETDGVARDEELEYLYDVFLGAYEEASKGGETVNRTLELYVAWHKWVLAETKGNQAHEWDWTDASIEGAAQILVETKNKYFEDYADGWAERKKAAAEAYREYYATSLTAENKLELYTKMTDAQDELKDYVAANEPDVTQLRPLERPDIANMSAKFEELYNAIRTKYTEHYVNGSGDCKEMPAQVICE